MRYTLSLSILFCVMVLPAVAELTPEDLDKIRLIVKEEVKAETAPLNAKIQALDTRLQNVEQGVSWMRGKMEGFDKQFESVNKQFESVGKQISHATNVTYGLIALIVLAVGVPQILIALRNQKDRERDKQIQELREEIETLKQQRIVGS